MARARFAWGIDVGNRALKAIKLVPDGDRLRVDDLEVIEHEQILSQSGDNRDSLIQSALQNFASRHPTKGGAVAISLSGQASFARFIKLPPVEKSKIPEIVKFEAIQQIPFPLDEVEWAYQLFGEDDSPDVEVGIFAIRKDRLQPIIQNYNDLNINVDYVQLGPLAVYNAMQYDQRITGPTMIVDVGAENTDLIIADGETVWLRTIAVGGNNFTEALTKQFKLNFPKAEELKRNAATSKYARQIFQHMRPVFADLVSEIQRSMGFYASVHRESRIKRIIALGSTFRLPTLQKYLQQNLQMDVERIDSFGTGGGTPADARIAATLNENIGSLTTAYGLAVQAMNQGKITNSLLPADIRKAKLWKSKVKWFGVAAACVALGTGAGYAKWYIDKDAIDKQKDHVAEIDKVLAKATANDNQWKQISSEGAKQLEEIVGVKQMLDYRDIWRKLIADISRSLPPVPPDKFAGVERSARKQVIINSIQSEYRVDVADLLKLDDNAFMHVVPGGTGGAGGQGDRSTPVVQPTGEAGATRGFLLTIHCRTPKKEGAGFLLAPPDGMIPKLLEINVDKVNADKKNGKESRPYYIARATVSDRKQISKGGEGAGKSIPSLGFTGEIVNVNVDPYENNSGGGGGGGGGGAAAPTPAPTAGVRGRTFDRGSSPDAAAGGAQPSTPVAGATGTGQVIPDPFDPTQDMSNDWDLTVLVLVVLDPAPPKPAEPVAPPRGKAPQRTASIQ